MAENKDYIINNTGKGIVNVNEDVLTSIAGVAAMEVEGVGGLTSGSVDITEILGMKANSKGIRLRMDGDFCQLDIFISVKYGTVIPTISKAVQEKIYASVESMTGIRLNSVNVHVTDVLFEKTK